MHTNENDPAFPSDAACPSWQCRKPSSGLTAREHAAIHLRVPMSNNPWLDEMITEARRWDAAQAVMAAMIPTGGYDLRDRHTLPEMPSIGRCSRAAADTLTSQMKGESK